MMGNREKIKKLSVIPVEARIQMSLMGKQGPGFPFSRE
jgi:hypothetical protein